MADRPWVVGHRGFPVVAPENTFASFEAAIAAGARMVEFDVTLTRDKVPVVFHDHTLDRTTNGKGAIPRKTLAEIRDLDAGSWFSPKFSAERIPLFTDLLDRLGGRVQMNIEIKRDAVSLFPIRGIEAIVVEEVRKRNLQAGVIVSSFSPRTVRRVKKLAPELETAILHAGPLNQDPGKFITRARADAVHLSIRALDEAMVRRIQERKIPLRVYTVNEEDDIRRMANWGVDGIFSDQVARALSLVRP
ncbi:MAG: glycerophosphodiester phosphodiesterase family protein [Pseudomonadota bacterium]